MDSEKIKKIATKIINSFNKIEFPYEFTNIIALENHGHIVKKSPKEAPHCDEYDITYKAGSLLINVIHSYKDEKKNKVFISKA